MGNANKERCNAEVYCIFFVSRLLDGLSVSMYVTKETFEMAFCGKEWLVWHFIFGIYLFFKVMD